MSADSPFDYERDPHTRLDAWIARVEAQNQSEKPTPRAAFTVSSLCGLGGGTAFASVLARRVGFDVWDADLIRTLAERPEHRSRIINALDDAQRRTVDAILADTPDGLSETTCAQLEICAAIATHGRAIFLEQSANALFGPEHALRVRLEPTWETLVPHHAARAELTHDEAEAEMRAAAQNLADYARDTFGADISAASGYDLLLNSTTLTLYDAIDLVIEAYEARFSPESGWWHAAN